MSSDPNYELYNALLAMISDSEEEEVLDIARQYVQHRRQRQNNEGSSSRRRRSTGRPRTYIPRDRFAGNQLLMQHYFGDNPTYTDVHFERRFRMNRNMFIRIASDIENFNEHPFPSHFRFFHAGLDAAGRAPLSIYQKCTAALRQLAYGIPGDAADEYLQMGETTALEALDNFCKCVYDIYKNVYLRKPTAQDIQRLYATHDRIHGLPGMLGSIDCMHWAWDNCPTAWRGQYTRGDQGHPTIMLEAVASYDLWIWHSFFGVAGSNNDINVLNQSPLLNDVLSGDAPPSAFQVNNNTYPHGYYLADGIYPEWSSFVKSYSAPHDDKRRKFKRVQESARKDVERAFGVLQGRWQIIKNPARAWSTNKLKRVMYTCIILHNMNVEQNGFAISAPQPYYDHPTNLSGRTFAQIAESRLQNSQQLRHRETHHNLRHDLTEHVWTRDI